MTSKNAAAGLTILRRQQVEAETGLSRSTIYTRMRAGTFPPCVQLGARSVGWRRDAIEAWLADPTGYRAPADAPKSQALRPPPPPRKNAVPAATERVAPTGRTRPVTPAHALKASDIAKPANA